MDGGTESHSEYSAVPRVVQDYSTYPRVVQDSHSDINDLVHFKTIDIVCAFLLDCVISLEIDKCLYDRPI